MMLAKDRPELAHEQGGVDSGSRLCAAEVESLGAGVYGGSGSRQGPGKVVHEV